MKLYRISVLQVMFFFIEYVLHYSFSIIIFIKIVKTLLVRKTSKKMFHINYFVTSVLYLFLVNYISFFELVRYCGS